MLEVNGYDIVVFRGTAATGKNVGKPYEFAKLDRRLGNNQSFIKQAIANGATVIEKA
jgi:hypothetical protein